MKKDLTKLTPEEKLKLAEELQAEALAEQEEDGPEWFDGNKVDEVAYCESLMAQEEIRCIRDRIYTIEGLIDDQKMKSRIAIDLKPYVRTHLDKAVERILNTLKMFCLADPIPPTDDRIHFRNGTFLLESGFTPEREWTMNRLPVDYSPDAPAPERWLKFVSELMFEEDIPTLQEFLGYSLIATNRGQQMLLITGSGGEGKSRISALLPSILGDNLNIGSISKLESDKFYLAEQEAKLLMIDDDMKMEALNSTNVIKTVVTCDGKTDMEKKNRQSYQGLMYCRVIGLGNGALKALHDKSFGFYRRQLLIKTKDKPANRPSDKYLKEKLEQEVPGIVMWCLGGLMRLIANGFDFTVSERSVELKREIMDEDNNIQAFLDSTGYIEFDKNASSLMRDLYSAYQKWCADNAEKPMAASTFGKYLAQNEKELHIIRKKNLPCDGSKYARGYIGITTILDNFPRLLGDDPQLPF